jgi:hypothetical protein
VNATPGEVPAESIAFRVAVPAVAIRLPGTVTVNFVVPVYDVGLRIVVGTPLAAQLMVVAPSTNPLPFTVSVKPGPPATADTGLRLLMVTFDFGSLMAKLAGAEVTLFETTVTLTFPGAWISVEGTVAVSKVDFFRSVVSPRPLKNTFAPAAKS